MSKAARPGCVVRLGGLSSGRPMSGADGMGLIDGMDGGQAVTLPTDVLVDLMGEGTRQGGPSCRGRCRQARRCANGAAASLSTRSRSRRPGAVCCPGRCGSRRSAGSTWRRWGGRACRQSGGGAAKSASGAAPAPGRGRRSPWRVDRAAARGSPRPRLIRRGTTGQRGRVAGADVRGD